MAAKILTVEEQITKSKMRALHTGVKVWQLEDGTVKRFATPSTTEAGVAHEIVCKTLDPLDISCTCIAGQNGRYCKHLGAALLHLGVKLEMAIAAQEELIAPQQS